MIAISTIPRMTLARQRQTISASVARSITPLLLAIAAATTTTKEQSTKDETKETKAYQKPEIHL